MIEIAQQLSKELQHTKDTFSDPEKLYITFFYRVCPSDDLLDEEVCVVCVQKNSIKIIDIRAPKKYHAFYIEEYANILKDAVELVTATTFSKPKKDMEAFDKVAKEANELLGRVVIQ